MPTRGRVRLARQAELSASMAASEPARGLQRYCTGAGLTPLASEWWHFNDLEAYFHYRNVDVSTLKELARRWRPELVTGFKKAQKHTALADVHESIDEMRYYRQHFLQLAPAAAT